MNCDCSGYDGDGPSVYSSYDRKARKEHKCSECKGIIKKGEKYHYISGLWNGEWSEFKICIPCNNIARDFCPGGYDLGQLRFTIKECLDIDYLSNYQDDKD